MRDHERVITLKELINQFQSFVETIQKEIVHPQKSQFLSSRVDYLPHHFLSRNGTQLRLEIGERRHIADVLYIEKLGYKGKTPWGYAALENDIVRNTKSLYLIVYEGFEPVAFLGVRLEDKDIHITNVAVVPDWQQQGVGQQLFHFLKEVAREEAVKTLSLEVRVSNDQAQGLYHKLGFTSVRIKKNYYHGDGEDAVDMLLRLDQ